VWGQVRASILEKGNPGRIRNQRVRKKGGKARSDGNAEVIWEGADWKDSAHGKRWEHAIISVHETPADRGREKYITRIFPKRKRPRTEALLIIYD